MKINSPSERLRKSIDKAISDHKITQAEYERIVQAATEDENIDTFESALLAELQNMIENKTVQLVP